MNYQTLSILAAMLVSQGQAAPIAPCQTYINARAAGPQTAATKQAYNALRAADVSRQCMNAILRQVGSASQQQITYFNSNPKILELAAQNGVPITDISDAVFAKLKPDVFGNFLKKHRDTQCPHITLPYLNMAMSSKKFSSEITPDCFASIPNHVLAGQVVQANVKNLPEKVFLEIDDPLHENFYKGMTAAQLKHFQGANFFDDEGDRCARIPLHHVNPKILGEISPACLQNWLANFVAFGLYQTTQLTFEQMSSISAEHFRKASYSAFANLRNVFANQATTNKSAWTKANKEFIQVIADHEFWSSNLPADAVHNDLKITSRAFANMNSAAQGAVLEKVSSLPDDLFAHMSDASIQLITYTDAKDNKKDCLGFDCLSKLESHKNVAKIMEHVDEFICYGKTFQDFTKKKGQADNFYLAGKYMSRTCYKNLNVSALEVENSGNDVHENILQYVSLDTVKSIWCHKSGQKWTDLAESYGEDKKKNRVWPGILRNPKVCARLVKIETFHKLAKKGLTKTMDGFSSECLRVFPDFDKLTGEYIAAVGDNIYSAFTKAEASKIDAAKSSHVQIGNASARVSNVADHYATTLTAKSVLTIPDAVFSLMNEGYFVAMTEDAYSGITKEQFTQVPSAKITKVTAAQFSKMADGVKKSLSPEQISAIGSHGGPKSESEMAMLTALGAVSSSFNESQSKAYKARLGESSGAIGAAGTSLMVLAASLALVFPLL